jgi:hypothetical protein
LGKSVALQKFASGLSVRAYFVITVEGRETCDLYEIARGRKGNCEGRKQCRKLSAWVEKIVKTPSPADAGARRKRPALKRLDAFDEVKFRIGAQENLKSMVELAAVLD